MRRYTFGTWFVVVISLLITGLFLTFIYWRVASPTDDAWIEPGSLDVWQSDGVRIAPLLGEGSASEFRRGDKLVTVDGKPLLRVVDGLIRGAPVPPLRIGAQRMYSLSREGRRVNVIVLPQPYPPAAIIRNAWGLLLMVGVSLAVALLMFVRRPNELLVRSMLIWVQGLWSVTGFAIGLNVGDLFEPAHFFHWVVLVMGGLPLFAIGLIRFAVAFVPPVTPLLRLMNRPGAVVLTYMVPYAALIAFLIIGRASFINPLSWIATWIPAWTAIVILYGLLFLYLMLSGYRHTDDPVMRRKIQLVVYGGSLSGVIGFLVSAVPIIVVGRSLVSPSVLGVFGLPLTLSIAFAVFRYRLVDIDFVINRTLVFGALSLGLAVVYFGVLIALQTLIGPATDDRELFEIVTVLTTLIAVALFNPVRRRVQRWVDRRFYRSKFAAEQAFARFAAGAHSQVDIDRLTRDLSETVGRAMDAEHVSVWVRERR